LPDGVRFDFDAANELPAPSDANEEAVVQLGKVQRTSQRMVVSLQHGCFQAREVVRHQTQRAGTMLQRSTKLAGLVAKGARYAFDLIAHVGVGSYLRGRSLQDIRQDLADHQPAINIPASTLWEQQQRFLFFFGHLHEQAIPILRQYLAEHSPVIWLLDGTIEPGTPVFLGIPDQLRQARGGLQSWPASTAIGVPNTIASDSFLGEWGALETYPGCQKGVRRQWVGVNSSQRRGRGGAQSCL
jgi:hypothetical protein